ncbi:MAG: hypothetical protein P1U49_14725 [Minwuia sp.]|nr:hypothetical protein [Minwuia sp.]
MTPRIFASVWAVVLLLTVGSIMVIWNWQPVTEQQTLEAGTPIVVIGSSLSAAAIQQDQVPEGLLGDNRRHVVWFVPAISASETMALSRKAIDEGARVILIELNAFAYSDPPRVNRPDYLPGWVAALGDRSDEFTEHLREAISVAVDGNRTAVDYPAFRDSWDGVMRWQRNTALRPSGGEYTEDLASLTEVAARQNIDVVFFEPPRHRQRLQEIARELEMPLPRYLRTYVIPPDAIAMVASAAWPDALFADEVGHLNLSGQARFMAELQRYWRQSAGQR